MAIGGPKPRAHGLAFRIASVVAVFLLALGAFVGGAATSEFPGMAGESVLAWMYYAVGLFVFGGLDLGVPAGGPVLARTALWLAYFLAPALTASAVIDTALRLVRPNRTGHMRLQSHVVVVGSGQVGLAYLKAIRAVEPTKLVLLVDGEDGLLNLAEAEGFGTVKVLKADIRRQAAFELLALDRADRMVIVTDDDLVNLEAAWAAQALYPELPIAVHVADLTLLRPVRRLIKDHIKDATSPGKGHPLVFSTHRIGALHLYERFLRPHFEETGYKDVVVIGGFGSFAQTILELLRVTAANEIERIIIVDEAASKRVRQFGADVPLDALRYETVDGDLEDPGTWKRVDEALASVEATPIYLLATATEVVNFRASMLLRARSSEPRIFVRCFHRNQFSESLAEQVPFELLVFEEVLRDALIEHYEALRIL